MTNLERIKQMTDKEFVKFLKYTNFQTNYPVIEGIRLWSDEEVIEWLNSPVETSN